MSLELVKYDKIHSNKGLGVESYTKFLHSSRVSLLTFVSLYDTSDLRRNREEDGFPVATVNSLRLSCSAI